MHGDHACIMHALCMHEDYAHTCTCMNLHICLRTCTCALVYMHVHMCMRMHMHVQLRMHMDYDMDVCAQGLMHARACARICSIPAGKRMFPAVGAALPRVVGPRPQGACFLHVFGRRAGVREAGILMHSFVHIPNWQYPAGKRHFLRRGRACSVQAGYRDFPRVMQHYARCEAAANLPDLHLTGIMQGYAHGTFFTESQPAGMLVASVHISGVMQHYAPRRRCA